MTDIERGRIGGGLGGDGDRLPWLEPVESELDEPGVGAGKLIAAVLVALVAVGLVVGGLFWLRERSGAGDETGTGDLIAAPAGDYKIAPTDPGGMNVEGEGDATYAASQGVPVDAAIDISSRPEAPVAMARAAEPVKTAPLPATNAAVPAAAVPAPARPVLATPTPTPAKPPEVVRKPVETARKPDAPKPDAPKPEVAKADATRPAAAGASVQLGAFGTEAKAQAAWKDLSGRFPALRALSHSVTLAEVGGKKLYRLRAAGGGKDRATTVCRALASAKEACNVIG